MEHLALRCIAAVFLTLLTVGCCSNTFIAITTVRSRRLHNTCNILIAFCAVSDALHQLGQVPKIIQSFYGEFGISSITCCMSQIIPNFGLSSGTILVLLIAIDRFLAVYAPAFYSSKKPGLYLMFHILMILAYAVMQYAFAYYYFENKQVYCNPSEMYHGQAKELWGMTSLTVITVSILIYYAVRRKLKNTAGLGNDRHLFRSIFAVMGVIILGLLMTMGSFTLQVVLFDLQGESVLNGSELAGLPVNTTLALNCAVLYLTSHEMLWVLLLLIALVVFSFCINRILGLPPGPPPLPFLGNMISFQWDLDKVLLDWKARYGRIFTVWLPLPMVVIGDHKVLQEHVVKNGNNFIDRKNPEQLLDLWFGGLYGLAFQDNSMVKEQRKFALKVFHEIGFNSTAVEDTVHNYSVEVVSRWNKSKGAVVDVTENITKAIGNVIWNLTFGIDLDFDNELLPKYRKLQQDFLPLMAGPLMMFIELFPFLRKLDFLFGNHTQRLKALFDENNQIVDDAIKFTEKTFNPDNQPRCYIEAFLREMKKFEESGKPLGNFHHRQMLASAVNIWGAGFETSVGFLRMCCIELVNHPEVQWKLQKEIDHVIGERRIRYKDEKLLPYTCAFLQEIHRLSNVLPINFLRQTSEDTMIEGRHIAAGTTILPQFSMVHFDPNEFERPDYFCPDRHIDDNGHFIKDPRINPFSVGKRDCLGKNLASMEIFVMFATFVQSCHFSPVGKVPPAVEFTHGFTRAVAEFKVKIDPRNRHI